MKADILAPWARLMPSSVGPMTAREFARLPDDARGLELVDGRVVKTMPTAGGHGAIAMACATAMFAFVQTHGLGRVLPAETGFDLSIFGQPNTVLAPDVAFVRADRLPARDSEEWNEFWQVAPDLVVEVVSPSQYRPELAAKMRRWLAAGVQLGWVVWPKVQQVDVWQSGAADPVATLELDAILDGQDVLPGFRCPVAQLFA